MRKLLLLVRSLLLVAVTATTSSNDTPVPNPISEDISSVLSASIQPEIPSAQPSVQSEIQSVPSVQSEIQSIPSVQSEIQSIPSVQSEIQSISSVQPLVQSEIQLIPSVQSEIQSIPSVQSEIQSVPSVQSEIQSVPSVQSEIQSIPSVQPSVQSEIQSVPSVQSEIQSVQPSEVQPSPVANSIESNTNTNTNTNTYPDAGSSIQPNSVSNSIVSQPSDDINTDDLNFLDDGSSQQGPSSIPLINPSVQPSSIDYHPSSKINAESSSGVIPVFAPSEARAPAKPPAFEISSSASSVQVSSQQQQPSIQPSSVEPVQSNSPSPSSVVPSPSSVIPLVPPEVQVSPSSAAPLIPPEVQVSPSSVLPSSSISQLGPSILVSPPVSSPPTSSIPSQQISSQEINFSEFSGSFNVPSWLLSSNAPSSSFSEQLSPSSLDYSQAIHSRVADSSTTTLPLIVPPTTTTTPTLISESSTLSNFLKPSADREFSVHFPVLSPSSIENEPPSSIQSVASSTILSQAAPLSPAQAASSPSSILEPIGSSVASEYISSNSLSQIPVEAVDAKQAPSSSSLSSILSNTDNIEAISSNLEQATPSRPVDNNATPTANSGTVLDSASQINSQSISRDDASYAEIAQSSVNVQNSASNFANSVPSADSSNTIPQPEDNTPTTSTVSEFTASNVDVSSVHIASKDADSSPNSVSNHDALNSVAPSVDVDIVSSNSIPTQVLTESSSAVPPNAGFDISSDINIPSENIESDSNLVVTSTSRPSQGTFQNNPTNSRTITNQIPSSASPPPATPTGPKALSSDENWLPSGIIFQSDFATTVSSSFNPTATKSLPQFIAPPKMTVNSPNTTLVTIGLKQGLNYQFLIDNPLSSAQIFNFLPSVLTYPFSSYAPNDFPINSLIDDNALAFLDSNLFNASTISVHGIVPLLIPGHEFFVSVVEVYFPNDLLDSLSALIKDRNSSLYSNPNDSLSALARLIDPSIPLTGLISGSSIESTSNSDADYNSNQSGNTRQSRKGKGLPSNLSIVGSLDNYDKNPEKEEHKNRVISIVLPTVLPLGLLFIWCLFFILMSRTQRRRKGNATIEKSNIKVDNTSGYHDNGRSNYKDNVYDGILDEKHYSSSEGVSNGSTMAGLAYAFNNFVGGPNMYSSYDTGALADSTLYSSSNQLQIQRENSSPWPAQYITAPSRKSQHSTEEVSPITLVPRIDSDVYNLQKQEMMAENVSGTFSLGSDIFIDDDEDENVKDLQIEDVDEFDEELYKRLSKFTDYRDVNNRSF